MPEPLPNPFYYLTNFEFVLNWIGTRYDDLLDDTEREFLAAFPGLPQAARALLVRLIMRKGEHFLDSKLRYAEIGVTAAALAPLIAKGWVADDSELPLATLFQLLTKAQLSGIFETSIPCKNATKSEWFAALQSLFDTPKTFQRWCPALADRCYVLRIGALCERFRLMFFGNLRQDWSEFVITELGLYRCEPVPFTADSRAFNVRSDIDDYLFLHRCRERLDSDESAATIATDIFTIVNSNPWIRMRQTKLLFQLARRCERAGEWSQAAALYRETQWPGARARLIRVLERMQQFTEALVLAQAAADTPESADELLQVQRMLPRLRRALAMPVAPRHRAIERTIELILPRHAEMLSVEMVTREHLQQAAAPVYYVENALLNSLFGLLCWDAIFAPIPGAFFHPFQSGPADLLQADFATRRQTLFDRCFEQLHTGCHRDTIRSNFKNKYGLQSPFVFWSTLTVELLEHALNCIPPLHLLCCFERLLQDMRRHRAGMPDLIQFWPEQKTYRMIEVKGPGDRLQDNQRHWLAHCARHDLPVVVCYVRWQEAA